ncbi:MAG TPA: phosphotransferase [Caldilineaceae bacterium]|nr:phosphotransferase [Caldilineaceae bacterium]
MKLQVEQIAAYMAQQLQADVQILHVGRLGASSSPQLASALILGETVLPQSADAAVLKTYSYGNPLLVTCLVNGRYKRYVLQTVAANCFDHQHRSDRAGEVLLSYDTFNELPQHAKAIDVGMITSDHRLISLADGDEFFLLTEYVRGTPYASDLQRLRDTGETTGLDLMRARQLAIYLADIHRVKGSDPTLYTRRIREVLYGGEGIMGLVDSYVQMNTQAAFHTNGTHPSGPDLHRQNANHNATQRSKRAVCDQRAMQQTKQRERTEEHAPDLPGTRAWFEELEKCCVTWRWRLHDKTHRLAQVHGDFHPFNVLFEHNHGTFHTLGRSRGAWGEPADDVACMAINYLFFSLQRSGTLTSPFEQLWNIFWNSYLDLCKDPELLLVIGPFFAWRALVLASPIWYNVSDSVRTKLLRFAEHSLHYDLFEPAAVKQYL